MIPLRIDNLTKCIGRKFILDDVSITLDEGTVFGLIGRNGAGKTTTISCTLGFTKTTSGTIQFFGESLQPKTFDRVAFVPEILAIDGWMTVRQHIEFRRRCFPNFDATAMTKLTERFEIDVRRQVRKMSKGQRQSVALALAFAQRPELMILDEPASGLDPILQRRLLDTIVGAAADGMSIIFSSHQIGHVEQAAERIGILDRGKLVLEADVDELRAQRVVVEAIFEESPAVMNLEGVRPEAIAREGTCLRVYANGNAGAVESQLRALRPLSISRRGMNLEQIFFATVGNAQEYRA